MTFRMPMVNCNERKFSPHCLLSLSLDRHVSSFPLLISGAAESTLPQGLQGRGWGRGGGSSSTRLIFNYLHSSKVWIHSINHEDPICSGKVRRCWLERGRVRPVVWSPPAPQPWLSLETGGGSRGEYSGSRVMPARIMTATHWCLFCKHVLQTAR